MKTTGCASLKTAGNVSGPNIIFQACFLALGICFLDRFSKFISPFYGWRFPKSSQKNARNPISFNDLSLSGVSRNAGM